MVVRKIDETTVPAHVLVEISFTPEEFDKVTTNALWERGGGVEEYIRWRALGGQSRGC